MLLNTLWAIDLSSLMTREQLQLTAKSATQLTTLCVYVFVIRFGTFTKAMTHEIVLPPELLTLPIKFWKSIHFVDWTAVSLEAKTIGILDNLSFDSN